MITSIDYPPRAGLPEWEAGTNVMSHQWNLAPEYR
jgi:hypothetical protein